MSTVSMSDNLSPKSLKDIDAEIARLRAEYTPRQARSATDMPASGMGVAFAIASHLVAGLAGGAAIGYFLDRWLDTSPWCLVAFFFLGSAAGMLNVYRMVSGMGMALGYRPAPPRKDDRSEEKASRGPGSGRRGQ